MGDALKTDLDTALRFLDWAHPGGPWVLTAIPVEGGRTTTATFHDAGAARGWLAERSGRENIYWTVNRVRGVMDKKPKKEDVEEAVMLHVDIDPRKGEDVAKEQARILKLLEDFSPSPSAIVFSGGGYQAFWRLDEPMYIGGTAERWTDVEAYNRQLGLVLGGDNTWNIDRIMRLPGTINLPDDKKRKKGRVEALAAVIELGGVTYPLRDFTPAPEQKASGNGTVEITDLPRVALDDLPAAVSQRTRMLIVQGDDPDDATRYGSKSEAMWAVACEMVRAGCTDAQIAAVLLDPGYGVSDHPLRQKRSRDYVVRQIERARDEVAEPMLREINERHFAIGSIGGKFRVASWKRSEIDAGRDLLEYQGIGDFANRYMHRRVQVGTSKDGNPVYAPAGKWWLQHPMRRQYETVVFAPNEAVDDLEEFNLWRGLAVTPAAGDWSLLRRLLWEALASEDTRHFEYILRWLAFAAQHPEKPAEVALVFKGGRGIGKSTIGHVMRRIFGQHGMNVTHSRHLHGNFNDHLHDCCLLFADEAVAPGDREAEQMIKVMITEPTMLIEPKGLGKFLARNRLHVIMASNERWVVPAGADERRFAVFDVSPHLAVPPGAASDHQSARFWKALYAEMDGGGIAAFLEHLSSVNLDGWHPRDQVPQTSGLLDQKVSSLRDFPRVWFELLASGELPDLPSTEDRGSDSVFISTRQLWQYAHAVRSRDERITETEVGMFFDKMGFRKVEKSRPRGYIVPPLPNARRCWDERMFRNGWGSSATWGIDAPRDKDEGPY